MDISNRNVKEKLVFSYKFLSKDRLALQDSTKAPSLERILKANDSINKLPQDKKPKVPSDVADRFSYSPTDASPQSQSVAEKSSFDKGRFIEQDRKEYITEHRQSFIAKTVLPISIGLIVLLIILYAFKDGLGKFLSKLRG